MFTLYKNSTDFQDHPTIENHFDIDNTQDREKTLSIDSNSSNDDIHNPIHNPVIDSNDDVIDSNDDVIDSNDDDELNTDDKIYIISVDNIPHFYEENFDLAKKKMWEIATNILKTSNETDFDNDNFILSRNVHQVQIVYPYKFLMLNYNHILFNLRIDYVVKYDNFHKCKNLTSSKNINI